MIAPLYRIRDWSKHFENNRTKELVRMAWLPLPNKMDGEGFSELLDHPDGAAHFGAWCLILEVASRCDPRGTLLRDGAGPTAVPHDCASLARKTRARAEVFESALPRLLSIGWVELIPFESNNLQEGAAQPQEGAAQPQEGAVVRARARNGTEGTEGKEEGATPRTAPLASSSPENSAERTQSGEAPPRSAAPPRRRIVEIIPVPFEAFPAVLQTAAFRDRWEMWLEERRAKKKPATRNAQEIALAELAGWGHDRAVIALGKSIASGWTGVFEPDTPKNGAAPKPRPPLVNNVRIDRC
jgi:hypothetical protein